MTTPEFRETNIPDLIEPVIKMDLANDVISIYSGQFTLRQLTTELVIEGKIGFRWFPSPGAYFEGSFQGQIRHQEFDGTFQLIIDGTLFANCFITSLTSKFHETYVFGLVQPKSIKGDKSIPVQSIRFSIPNLRDIYGDVVRRTTKNQNYTGMNRILFETDNFIIKIDKSHQYQELERKLRLNGGYIVLYGGEIKKKKGSILLNEIEDLLYCLSTYLSFVNGRRTAVLFAHGIHDDEVIWEDYTAYNVSSYKNVQSWPARLSIKGIQNSWNTYYDLWKNRHDKDFLTSAIHWYVECNGNAGSVEGSLIMAQTALELLYNWLVVEKRQLLVGKDAEGLAASNKIRLLLAQIQTSTQVPTNFSDLQAFVKASKEINDGPEAIVQIRNAIVHSQQEKRRKLTNIDEGVRYEALQLSIWYIELALLFIFDFKGQYSNRCSDGQYVSDAEEIVPWSKQ